MTTVFKFVVLVAVFMHGVGHIMGLLGAWTNVPVGTNDRPWLLGGGVTLRSPIGKVFGLIWLAALLLFVASVIGVLTGQAWWPTTAIIGAVVSLVGILPFWRSVAPGARYGGVLFDLVILVALLPGWKDQVIAFLQ